jgi:hypothetical protein
MLECVVVNKIHSLKKKKKKKKIYLIKHYVIYFRWYTNSFNRGTVYQLMSTSLF